ncbi:MAG TPA: hypothetical protein VLW54_08400 [Candidatus Acidoferrales bacterium]|nr:hypothetical protein [Candidatus Acidoferrales bacterium]
MTREPEDGDDRGMFLGREAELARLGAALRASVGVGIWGPAARRLEELTATVERLLECEGSERAGAIRPLVEQLESALESGERGR